LKIVLKKYFVTNSIFVKFLQLLIHFQNEIKKFFIFIKKNNIELTLFMLNQNKNSLHFGNHNNTKVNINFNSKLHLSES
jgi:hypothetical protein